LADDSELDYLRTFLQYACRLSTVKHYSEKRLLSHINDTRRILIYPGVTLSTDGKFYKKRYKVKISDTSEAALTETFNLIVNGIINTLIRGQGATSYYTSTHFDVNAQDTMPYGICWDGTNFWVVGETNTNVYKYTAAGVYVSSWDTSGETGFPKGICWDSTYFWILSSSPDFIYKYNSAGVYQSVSIDVSGEDAQGRGITWDGTHLWTIGLVSKTAYKYTTTAYANESFYVGGEDTTPVGICWDGTHFWVVGFATKTLYKYTAAGVYTGTSIYVGDDITNPNYIEWDDTHFWILELGANEVYKYNREIYNKPSVLCYIKLVHGNRDFEHGETKRWQKEIVLDVEWCIE